ncbi:MAG: hypothetical protein E7157_00255 [Lactobacillales bacterium]|nr:hypothetical protein [Lactobacillales bacterium]
MNLYLLEMFLKFLRMIFVAFISLFNITLYAEDAEVKENSIMNANTYAMNTVVIKEEVKPMVNKPVQPTTVKKTTTPTVTKKTPSKTTNKVVPSTNSNKVVTSSKTGTSLAEYTGRLTGYGPDCVGCSKVGNVACRTREKKAHSLIKDGIYYNDKQYGKVRILAAATSKFKCGTIVMVTKPGMEPFVGIVLDTGGSMRKAWAKGNVWMDLAYSSNAMAGSDKLTGKNIKFSVQRWGW